MSSVTTVAATAIELTDTTTIRERNETNWQASTTPANPDNIVEVSRAYDASAPDGGYGWVVVGVCGVLCFWFIGTTYSWGIIQAALIEKKLAPTSTLAFVGSLSIACNAAFALPNSRLLVALGARTLAVIGLLSMGFGQILSGFTERNVGGLFITAGLMMGYGVSACYMCSSVVAAQYFNRRRGLANGIIFAAGGLGGAVISLSMSAIVENLGTAWTFRLTGLLMLVTGLPLTYFLRERAPIRSAAFIDWSLFRDGKFIAIFATGAVATFPLCVPVFFLPLYARSLGYSAYTGAALVAGFNFASAVGRIGIGFAGDKIGPLNSLLCTLTVNALSMLCLWPISSSLAPLVVFVVINGMGNGGFFAIMPTVVSNVFGSVRVAVAMGTIVTSWTGGYLMGAPIAGYLLDAYGGEQAGFTAYRPAIFYAGSLGLAAALIVLFLRLRMSIRILERL